MSRGQLVIIATGNPVDEFGVFEDRRAKQLEENLGNDNWHLCDSIFINTYRFFDGRNSQSRVNKLFCHKVFAALEEGANIVIVASNAGAVDKRLREQAIVLQIPACTGRDTPLAC